MLGTCGVMQMSEYVKLWGEINGVRTKLEAVSLDDVDRMYPGGFGIEVGQTACYVREYGWDGGEGAILPQDAGVKLEELTSIESYITNTDWSSVLSTAD
jgi:hypothetical protein